MPDAPELSSIIQYTPVGRVSEVRDLSQVVHTVQHRKDLLGMTHEVRVDVIYMTWKATDILS